MLIDSFAISLLGLEPQFYLQASTAEKGSIKWVLYSFVVITILSLIATYLIGLFVSGRYYFALPISILGTYILISILRFSLILIKPEIKIIRKINETILKTTLKEKWTKLKSGLSTLWSNIKIFRWNSNAAIPGFTIFFRLLYMGLLAFIIIFPLVVLLNWSDASSYNNQLREKALSNYYNTEKSFQNQTHQSSSLSDLTKRMTWYENKVSHEFFTMKIFVRATNYSNFGLITCLVFGLFLLPHLLLFRLMRKSEYNSVSSVNEYFESIITSDFNTLQQDAKRILKSKGYKLDSMSFLTKNNPYKAYEPELNPLENVTLESWKSKISNVDETKIEVSA